MVYFSNYRFGMNSSTLLTKEDHRLFKLSLLMYDNVYFWLNPNKASFYKLDYTLAEKNFNLPKKYLRKDKYNFQNYEIEAEDFFKPLFEYSPIVLENLSTNVNSIQNISPNSFFIKEIKKMINLNQFPSISLYNTLLGMKRKVNDKEYNLFEYEIEHRQYYVIESIMWDFLLASYLNKHFNIGTVFTSGELYILELLKKSKSFHLWNSTSQNVSPKLHPFTKEIGCYTSHGLVKNILGNNSSIEFIGDEIIPDISEVPTYEISNFIKKDKHKPIVNELNEILKKYNGKVSKTDIMGEMLIKYRELTNILAPGIGDISIGFIGNIPSPIIINPIGIYGATQEARKYLKAKSDYAFLLSINDLSKLRQKY